MQFARENTLFPAEDRAFQRGHRMNTLRLSCLFAVAWTLATPAAAQRYAAVQDGQIVRLTDRTTDTIVSIAPSVGNIAFEMRVKGQNVLRFPHATMAELCARAG